MTSRKVERFEADEAHAGQRLDKVVSELACITRSQAIALIDGGFVSVGGSSSKPSHKVRWGEQIVIEAPEQEEGVLMPEDIPLDILYSDEHLIVVNKPAGLVVYPAAGHATGTLMNALLHRFGRLASVGGPLRPGVVHRLDKDTSGVMVVALTDSAYYDLVEQFKVKSTGRQYKAIVHGQLKADSGVIDAVIGRSTSDRKKMSTKTNSGKAARTRWKRVLALNSATLVDAVLETGRTHQIRVHFSSIGHSVLGDDTYGHKTKVSLKGRVLSVPRQMLHAESLAFDHPATGKRMEFTAGMPQDMLDVIEALSES